MRPVFALAVGVLALAAGACGSGEGGTPTVFAAASLTEVFPAITEEAVYNFAGSDDLATQIREGAKADVFAAASPKYPTELFAEGLVDEPRVFATNRLVLIVPADNPAGIESVGDLRQDGVKLVIGAEGVPVGDYTRKVLENLDAEDVLDNVVSEEDDVKGVVGKVALGEADAGFVYATDVKPVADDVRVVELPEEAQPAVEYLIAVLVESDRKDEAEAFVDLVLSEQGRNALVEAGFGVP
jgi:molybdate transport system substrate-binding protein